MLSIIRRIQEKNLHNWALPWARHAIGESVASLRGERRVDGPRHLLFALCDHYEPLWRKPTPEVAEARVQRWEDDYPKMAKGFYDADGLPPRHSFFFPGEEYSPSYLDRLARLAKQGFGEVELHLHHDRDNADNLRRSIGDFLGKFAAHGHLTRDPDGRLRYAFIHGNWALCNPRSDGRRCGVDNELPILFETGCYADYTFPSAPDESQPKWVNRIYWPTGDLARRRAYEHGERAKVGKTYSDRVLLIEGPLALSRKPNRWAPAVEAGDLTGVAPPHPQRISSWVGQNIHVEGRPDWVFVKVHTHGAKETIAASLLGDGGRTLHQTLTTRYNDGKNWKLHYVTAREMYNIAMAAMNGKSGNPADFRDFVLPPPPVVR